MEYKIQLAEGFLEEFDEICHYISTKLKATEAIYVTHIYYSGKNYIDGLL